MINIIKGVGITLTIFMGWFLFNSMYKRLRVEAQKDTLFIIWVILLHLSWTIAVINTIFNFKLNPFIN
jgi:hypothetical protein